MGSERRRFERTTLPVPLKFRYAEDRTARWHDGLLLDLSAGGMRFAADEIIPLGAPLQFEMYFPIRMHPYRFNGRTVWVREGRDMQYGAELLDVTPRQENELAELIQFLNVPPKAAPDAG